MPVDGVLTAYPHPGGNLPPTVVAWEAQPSFLKVPASRVRLLAAGRDPEQDRLSYSWSVTAQPRGTRAAIADPQSPSAEATGLTAAGRYVFTVAVSDGTSTVRRQVLLNVLEGNQPPVLNDVHSRLPVVLTLPDGTVELRGGAMDLEGDKLSFRWSLVRQPPGSSVQLESPGEAKCKVTNISKPGNLVLKLEASDGTSTVAEELTVPVHPVNAAPVIDAAQAAPATLAPSDGTTFLSATTRDPDGDCISHWWRVKACPPGARPVFAVQSGRDTKVSGLTVEGAYEFELTVVDRTKSATRKVVVTVAGKGGTHGH